MIKEHITHHSSHSHESGKGRGGRRHGFGHRMGRGFGRGLGRGDFPAGRKLSSDELQLVLLSLLGERPAHGYELIRQLEEHSGGFYTPSPGMIYPALTYLDEIGHTASSKDGNRKLYTLTDTGRAYLDTRREQAATILETLARIGGRMAEVREAFAGPDGTDGPDNEALHQARHGIRNALRSKRGCGTEEARRIATILERATAEILGQS